MLGRWTTLLFLAAILAGYSGCRQVGPPSIVADRVPYNEAIATSWKEQTLLNIVKLRYADVPFFVDVAQIVAGYTRENSGSAELGSEVYPKATTDNFIAPLVGLSTTFTDRPTISYTPQTGAQFIRNLTNPIPPSAVLFLIESGYPADVVLRFAVTSINGIRNRSTSLEGTRPSDPEFERILSVIRKAQDSSSVHMRVVVDSNKQETVLMSFHDAGLDPELAAELSEVKQLLQLDPSEHDFKVVFGSVSTRPNEIAMLTNSIIRILTQLSTHVEVPEEHLAQGRASSINNLDESSDAPLAIHSGCEKPCDCFAAVCYRGYWFWVDDCDSRSKRTFAYLLVLLALADTAPREGLPLVTIPAG